VTRPGPSHELDGELRDRLARLADGLIPEAGGMPAASSVDIAGTQLDSVIASRPDLVPGILRALGVAGDVLDPIRWSEALRVDDPSAYDALVTTIVAGYYMHPEIRRLLGYPGQVPQEINVGRLPDYAEEGLLERVYERGPIYRPTPE